MKMKKLKTRFSAIGILACLGVAMFTISGCSCDKETSKKDAQTQTDPTSEVKSGSTKAGANGGAGESGIAGSNGMDALKTPAGEAGTQTEATVKPTTAESSDAKKNDVKATSSAKKSDKKLESSSSKKNVKTDKKSEANGANGANGSSSNDGVKVSGKIDGKKVEAEAKKTA